MSLFIVSGSLSTFESHFRVQAGECYHLYSGYQLTKMADYIQPEILRTRLEEICLQVKVGSVFCTVKFTLNYTPN